MRLPLSLFIAHAIRLRHILLALLPFSITFGGVALLTLLVIVDIRRDLLSEYTILILD